MATLNATTNHRPALTHSTTPSLLCGATATHSLALTHIVGLTRTYYGLSFAGFPHIGHYEEMPYKGTKYRLQAQFADENGTPFDPTTVTFYTIDPSNNTTTAVYGVDADVGKSDTGLYFYTFELDEEGQWYCRVKSTGSMQATAEGQVYCRSNF